MISKKIKYLDIKNVLENNSIEVISEISEDENFSSIKTIANSTDKDISFFSNHKYLNDLKIIKAKACLIQKQFADHLPKNCKPIIVSDPYLALALISNIFNDEVFKSNGVISKNTNIYSYLWYNNNIVYFIRIILISVISCYY